MSFEYKMKFSKTGIAEGTTAITIFQPGRWQEAILLYAQAALVIPTALSTADQTKIFLQDENGINDSLYAETATETAVGTYYGDGDVTPSSLNGNHIQWAAYPRVYYPSKIMFQPPAQSGDTGGYYVVILAREMQGTS